MKGDILNVFNFQRCRCLSMVLAVDVRWLGNLALSWRRRLPYGNQSIDLLHNSMDWFLYDSGLRHGGLSAVVWRAVWKHMVADAFHSKRSSSALLAHEQLTPQKGCFSCRHSIACHQSTACGDYRKNIYESTSLQCQRQF